MGTMLLIFSLIVVWTLSGLGAAGVAYQAKTVVEVVAAFLAAAIFDFLWLVLVAKIFFRPQPPQKLWGRPFGYNSAPPSTPLNH
jgi:hypothetical protein